MANSPPDDATAKNNNTSTPSSAGSGVGTARAPEAPVRAEETPGLGRRRSDRVVVAITIDFTGTDQKGTQFTEACYTEMVSLHGATVAVSRRASLEHPVTLRRRALDVEVRARILGQLGIRPGFHAYGIAFTENTPDFWGIRFPPFDDNNDSLARTLLQCAECGKQLIFTLNEIEFRVFDANQRLTFGCETCGRNVVWKPVPLEIHAGWGVAALKRPNQRKYLRTKMKSVACIQETGRDDDVVEVLDISRGGVSFRSERVYAVHSWIHFAVPYTQGAANIFSLAGSRGGES